MERVVLLLAVAPFFITFEGLDGSGKSTHLERVAGWLRAAGHEPVVTCEPGGTPLGEGIRELFLAPRASGALDGTVEVLLVFASRRQHLIEVIEPSLRAGRHVLCDRFTDSTYAYQGHGRGVPRPVIDRIDAAATGRRRPDRTLLFDLAAEIAQRRGQSRRRRREGRVNRLDREQVEFYRRVREGFLERARLDPDRFRIVTSDGSLEETSRQVKEALADLVNVEPEVHGARQA